MEEGVRIDKWLWAVRVFKTRTLAADACRGGRVKIGDAQVKASRLVKPGEIVVVSLGQITRTLRIRALLKNRVAAKMVADWMEDLTPPEEYEKLNRDREGVFGHRPKGVGRPTKRERRVIEILKKKQ
jgi:ribosome-associated heat shock protein Hsp15